MATLCKENSIEGFGDTSVMWIDKKVDNGLRITNMAYLTPCTMMGKPTSIEPVLSQL